MDYLAYAYLQTGQDAGAQRVLADLNAMQKVDRADLHRRLCGHRGPGADRAGEPALEGGRVADSCRTMSLKLAPLENFQWAEAHVHFARAVGAARSGDAAQAREEVGQAQGDRGRARRPARHLRLAQAGLDRAADRRGLARLCRGQEG